MRRLAVVICALLGACSSGGESSLQRLELSGQMVQASASLTLGSTKLALAWYPSFVGVGPTAPPGAVVTQPGVTYSGAFPVAFTFSFEGAPPKAALYDLSSEGGTGHLAYGVLLAYQDGNDNGEFDAIADGHTLVDRIVGTSVPDLSAPPPEHSYYVIYLDGTLPESNYFSAFDLPQGYSLLKLHYNFGVEPVPLDTPVDIPITNTDALDLYACPAAWDDISTSYYRTSCGIDPFAGSYRAEGYVYGNGDRSEVQFYIYDGTGNVTDASVKLDGQAVPLTQDAGFDGSFGVLDGAHTVALDVPGYASDDITFTLPAPVVLSTPISGASIPSGSQVSISWAASAGVVYYDVYFYASVDSPSGMKWLFHAITTDTSVTTSPITFSGTAYLSVKAIGAQANGSGNAFLTPVSQTGVRVNFTP